MVKYYVWGEVTEEASQVEAYCMYRLRSERVSRPFHQDPWKWDLTERIFADQQ